MHKRTDENKQGIKLQETMYKEGGGDYILTRQFPRGLSGAGVVWWSSAHLTVNQCWMTLACRSCKAANSWQDMAVMCRFVFEEICKHDKTANWRICITAKDVTFLC